MEKRNGNIISYATTGLLIFLLVVIIMSASENKDIVQLQDIALYSANKEERPERGFSAPEFTLYDMLGKKVSLSENRGKVVFLNIWATWCGPCLAEMPSMEKLYNRFKSDAFEILAVSVDKQGVEVVEPYAKRLGLTFPILIDTRDTVTSLYQIMSIPETFIIDKNGIIVSKVMGARNWSSEKSFKAIEYLINN